MSLVELDEVFALALVQVEQTSRLLSLVFVLMPVDSLQNHKLLNLKKSKINIGGRIVTDSAYCHQ